MSFTAGINTLREEGFSDEEIISNILEIRPDLKEGVNTLRAEEFDSGEIVSSLSEIELEDKKLGTKESAQAGLLEGVAGSSFLPLLEALDPILPRKPDDVTLPVDIQSQIETKPEEQRSFTENLAALMGEDDILPASILGPSDEEREQAFPGVLRPVSSFLENIPESEGKFNRFVREGAKGVGFSLPFGPKTIFPSIVGSLSGQSIRELGGPEWLAFVADIAGSILGGKAQDTLKEIPKFTKSSGLPSVFKQGETKLQRKAIETVVKGNGKELSNQINNTSKELLNNFEKNISDISPNRFQELKSSNITKASEQANQIFTENQLSKINPLPLNNEEAFSVVQKNANEIFGKNVIEKESNLYNIAKKSAKKSSGKLEKTLEEFKNLRQNILKGLPPESLTEEQRSVVNFIDANIQALEKKPVEGAPQILDQFGKPFQQAEKEVAETLTGDQMTELIKRGNQYVSYDNPVRQQSDRLKGVMNTMRNETASKLDEKALKDLKKANSLHAKNADVWGTKFMQNVRSTETPESLLALTKKATNLKNIKNALNDPSSQSIIERQIVESLIEGGESSKRVLGQITKDLSPQANKSANTLLSTKDAFKNPGSREAIRNGVMKDMILSLNTGKYPKQTMDMMSTSKGYEIVKSALSDTKNNRKIFKTLERTFIEEIFGSALDESGKIDFKKASQMINNKEVKSVIRKIGGDNLVKRFRNLENMSKNFQKNLDLYSNPQTKSLIERLKKKAGSITGFGAFLYYMGVPLPVISGLGIGISAGIGLAKSGKKTFDKLIQNPKFYNLLENISRAKTPDQLNKLLPRFLNEMEATLDSDELSEILGEEE